MRILLVEDDPTTSKSIELMLQNANLNVYATDLGEEGIDLAKLYDYDLILLDLNLPDMNGHDVLRQLRKAKVETPILILSGADDTENKLKGFGFGAAFLSSAGLSAAFVTGVLPPWAITSPTPVPTPAVSTSTAATPRAVFRAAMCITS